MKKVFLIISVVVLSLFAFAGCTDDKSKNNSSNSAGNVITAQQIDCWYNPHTDLYQFIVAIEVNETLYYPTSSPPGIVSSTIDQRGMFIGDDFGCLNSDDSDVFIPKGDTLYALFSLYSNEGNQKQQVTLTFPALIFKNITEDYFDFEQVFSNEFSVGI